MKTSKALLAYRKLLWLSTSEHVQAGKFSKEPMSDKDSSVAERFIGQIYNLSENMKISVSSASEAIVNGYTLVVPPAK